MTNSFWEDLNGKRYTIPIPDKCPICHHLVSIGNPSAKSWIELNKYQAVFQCPFKGCWNYFIAYYEVGVQGDARRELTLKSVQPFNVVNEKSPEIITAISPNFVAIYREATEAKQRGLLQIAGPGFRKAFEFLIKDYAKSKAPTNKHKEIESTFSGTVANNYIVDTRIQAVAKRALWLGNDETHYLRKWEEHNIDDLIKLIKLTINWIEIDLQSAEYIERMPEK